jgi:uncharacterized protein DUF3570
VQLERRATPPAPAVRQCLRAAACLLLGAGAPPPAHAQTGEAPASPTWQLDASGLFYSEQKRTSVYEPILRITRFLPGGQKLWAQTTVDAMSGASPTGSLPTGQAQTVTSASGKEEISADQLPTNRYHDMRAALDLGWERPIGSLVRPSVSVHGSREEDYTSFGASAELSVDLMQRLTTVTLGGGVNRDDVNPKDGTRAPLDSTGALIARDSNPKHVTSTLIGLSRILTRRWMMGVTASRIREDGHLTDPYKVVSVMDLSTGYPTGQFSEKRPDRRTRQAVQTSSVYHLERDILYLSHRYYWDDWGVRSNAVDARYRLQVSDGTFLQPHARFYTQTAADFFTFGLLQGQTLPAYASSDERLGPLRTVTLGATYGFRLPNRPGEFSLRAEYIRQWGDGHPANVVGVQRDYNLFPGENIGSVLASYSLQF